MARDVISFRLAMILKWLKNIVFVVSVAMNVFTLFSRHPSTITSHNLLADSLSRISDLIGSKSWYSLSYDYSINQDQASATIDHFHGSIRKLSSTSMDFDTSIHSMSMPQRQVQEDYTLSAEIPLSDIGKHIDVDEFKNLDLHLVFFAYLNKGRNWWYNLETYSELIKKTGILDTAKSFHICISADTNDDWFVDFKTKQGPSDHTIGIQRLKNATDLMSYHLRDYLHKIHFDLTLGNVFEFPGIHKMWTLAQGLPDALGPKSIFLYFHAKGIAMHGQVDGKDHHANYYFHDIVAHWKFAMRGFDECPKMKVACIEIADEGYCMGNHFFARGSFLWEVSKPKRSNNRYYYEHWLSLRDLNPVFPRNYTLNYAFVEFNESYRETWRYAPYLNGDSKNFWEIQTATKCSKQIK